MARANAHGGFQLWIALPPELELGRTVSDQLSGRAPEWWRALALRAPGWSTVLWIAIATGVCPNIAGRASRWRGAHRINQGETPPGRPFV